MSSAGWSTLSGAIATTGGWGGPPAQGDESIFHSLSPVNGLVSGEQVKGVFEASGLSKQRLAQIWNSVDQDRDGRINLSQFVMAMTLIRQAKQETLQRQSSLPVSGFASFPTTTANPLAQPWGTNSPAPTRGLGLGGPMTPDPLSKSWATNSPAPGSQATPRGVGVGVSMDTTKEGWGVSVADRRRYTMQFNTLDKNKTGLLNGSEISPIFSKTGVHTATLAKIWEMVDLDKDGRLNCEEFVVAMHLAEKVKSGLTLPRTIPAELFPGPAKYATVDRKAHTPSRKDQPLEKRASVIDPADWASRQSTPSEGSGLSFEDRRKENFEAGRQELERRRRAIQEEQERIAAEKERKKREEEERRLQQEREAEQARQAELERQRLKAIEIEKERALQMQKLALKREAEQREQERKRKEEWAKKRQAELEGERTKEKSALHILKDQHSRLEQELQVLDQQRLGAQASMERHRAMCMEISKIIRTLQMSREVRLEEMKKAQGELNNLQARVATLHQQRGVLQASLEQRSERSGYQAARNALNEQVIGLAALVAGLRTNFAHNREEADKRRASYLEYQQTLKDLSSAEASEEVKIQQLRILVETRKRAFQEKQRQDQERERVKEERLAKIKRDQEIALKKKRDALDTVMADLSAASSIPPTAKKTTPPIVNSVTQAKKNKETDAAMDKLMSKKLQELRKLQKEQAKKPDGAPPSRPVPYAAHKLMNVVKPRPYKSPESTPTSDKLVDLMSSWDRSGTISGGISQFKQDTSQILTPSKPEEPSDEAETTPTDIDHVVVSPTGDGNVQISSYSADQPISENSSIYAIPRLLTSHPPVTFSDTPTPSDTGQSSTAIEPQQNPAQEQTQQPSRYEAVFSFETSDPSEVNLQQGDIVMSDPSVRAPPGWLMVSILASGESGWAPESYLKLVTEEETKTATPEGVVSPPPLMATVLFTWKGSKDNHLSIVKGERISVLQQNEKWWSGEKDGQIGWFPRTFVKLEESNDDTTPTPAAIIATETAASQSPPVMTNQNAPRGQVYEAIYDYESSAEGDLNFQAGDVIEVITLDGDWWTGVLDGVQGIFPSNYVQPRYEVAPPLSKIVPAHSTPPQNTEAQGSVSLLNKPIVARVTVPFEAQKENQLSLSYGDLVKVLKQAPNGWWEGQLQSRGKQRVVGWFPANRVEPLGAKKPDTSNLPGRAKSPLLEVLEDSRSGGSENLVLALYKYDATSADELSFHKGSVLTVISKEGDWWRGELNGEIGLFPSNYVHPLMEQAQSAEPTRWAESVSSEVLASVSDKERKRQEAIFELLTSERHYNDSLKMVQEVFFDPMFDSNALTEEEIAKVHVNWRELIVCSANLLKAFMVRLRTAGAEVVKHIGDVLANQIPELTPHIRWCSCQITACDILQQKAGDPAFKEFEQKCKQDSRTKGLPLSSFLLKPMQRVTKYPLLIKRILEYTPDGELDHGDLKLALERAEKLCDQVNEAVRAKENTEQLEWLQTHIQFTLDEKLIFNSATNFMGSRRLLHWGKLFKIRGAKDVLAFLFNDFLLMVKPKLFFAKAATPADLEPFGKNEFQMYRQPFLLESLRVKKTSDDQNGQTVFLLYHSSEEKDIPLRADSEHKRDQWVKLITEACLNYIKTKKKIEREKKELRMRTMKDSVGFLKVTVVEGCDLLAKDPNGKSDPFCVLTLGGQQEQTTRTVHLSLNPKWNHTLEFYVHDINKDVLEVSVFDKDLFSPNDFLGCAKVCLKDLFELGDSPWTKRLLLEDVAKGEIELKIELELRASDLLL